MKFKTQLDFKNLAQSLKLTGKVFEPIRGKRELCRGYTTILTFSTSVAKKSLLSLIGSLRSLAGS